MAGGAVENFGLTYFSALALCPFAEGRRKLEPDPARPRWLITEPGMGYRYQPGPDAEPTGPDAGPDAGPAHCTRCPRGSP
ncbi:MAG TPA: hypothetical protein VGL63_12990 [Streptosporangiaceae bacterium]